VYDALGRLVATLHRAERQPAGVHHVVWNGRTAEGRPAASGTYFYRLDAGGTTQTRQMVLVR
jgi:flagellar hook assembly protein FlgD